jgi:hypothetical protein
VACGDYVVADLGDLAEAETVGGAVDSPVYLAQGGSGRR